MNFKVSDVIQRYFCVFCDDKFSNRNEVMDHYLTELKIKLKCSHCPQDLNFTSLESFMSHDSEHIKLMKTTFNPKSYSRIKSWIQSMVDFMESLTNQMVIQEQIHLKFGDCCPVCKCLNRLTPDSQPLFHKNVFATNRWSGTANGSDKCSVPTKFEFEKHLKQHMQYKPVYTCGPCVLKEVDPPFTCDQLNNNCRQHFESHQLGVQNNCDLTPFFSLNQIPELESKFLDFIHIYIINTSKY